MATSPFSIASNAACAGSVARRMPSVRAGLKPEILGVLIWVPLVPQQQAYAKTIAFTNVSVFFAETGQKNGFLFSRRRDQYYNFIQLSERNQDYVLNFATHLQIVTNRLINRWVVPDPCPLDMFSPRNRAGVSFLSGLKP
jgi:hypothetical protein